MKSVLVFLLCFTVHTLANVEKVMFLGPGPANEVDVAWNIDQVTSVESLSPQEPSLRRQLHSKFSHSPPLQEPSEAWVLLSDLHEGQRYEVRICWPATQPTAFELSLHTPIAIAKSEHLSDSLNTYSVSRTISLTKSMSGQQQLVTSQPEGLFLRITANADYFTTDPVLSNEGLLVDVEIILDPYLLNVLPRSLLPTAAYILVVALAAWYLSDWIWGTLEGFARGLDPRALGEKKKKVG